jgi:hypothetical protein
VRDHTRDHGRGGREPVTVLPVTHAPASDPALAVEIPAATKRRLGLDEARSWVVLTEANRFRWPGPDLRPAVPGDSATVVYGPLPHALFDEIRQNSPPRSARRAPGSCCGASKRDSDDEGGSTEAEHGPRLLRDASIGLPERSSEPDAVAAQIPGVTGDAGAR